MKNADEQRKPYYRSEIKIEVHLQVMRNSGGAPEFSGLVRSMQRPEFVQWSEVAEAELRRQRRCERKTKARRQGGNDKDPCRYL